MPDTTSDSHAERVGGLPLTRIEAFSDGVFAIAITLLVPMGPGDQHQPGGRDHE